MLLFDTLSKMKPHTVHTILNLLTNTRLTLFYDLCSLHLYYPLVILKFYSQITQWDQAVT